MLDTSAPFPLAHVPAAGPFWAGAAVAVAGDLFPPEDSKDRNCLSESLVVLPAHSAEEIHTRVRTRVNLAWCQFTAHPDRQYLL